MLVQWELSANDVSLLLQSLYQARDAWRKDAKDCVSVPRLREQFTRQADRAEKLISRFEEGDLHV